VRGRAPRLGEHSTEILAGLSGTGSGQDSREFPV
jgi:hypothetical protein